MRRTAGRSRRRTAWAAASAAVLAALGLMLLAPSASGAGAQAAALTPTFPVTGNATWFSGLGEPYGGCGLPQNSLDTQDFIALNVYNTPGDYTMYPRPLTGANAGKAGMWDNGHNCGRWVQVTISDYCNGVNDGAPNAAFCRNGSYVADQYNGATLNMIVADSCGDANGWCRDDPYHIDLSQPSLNRFTLNGSTVSGLADHWNNRHVSWKFIPAPNYSGDITIGFMRGAQSWWGAIAVSHLANGLHGVQYYSGGAWHDAAMNGDMGQSFIVSPLTSGGKDFRIRATDVNDTLVNGGREYSFSLPSSCGSQCSAAFTPVTYTTSGGSTTSPPPVTTTSPPPVTTTSPPPVTTTSPPPVTTTSPPPAGGCTAAYRVVQTWPGGYQAEIVVTAGSSPISGWSVSWTAPGQTINSGWNGQFTTSGNTVTVKNSAWNGSLAARGSTTAGFVAGGSPPSAPSPICVTA